MTVLESLLIILHMRTIFSMLSPQIFITITTARAAWRDPQPVAQKFYNINVLDLHLHAGLAQRPELPRLTLSAALLTPCLYPGSEAI